MGKYRSRIEIVADILSASLDGVRKTHIMYKCNLSYKLLNRYLGDVLKAKLLSWEENGNRYITTEKGKSFLRRFNSYVEHSKRVDREIGEVYHKRESLESMF